MADRAYKFRIYPNDEQKILFAKTFGCVRMVYNHSVGHTGIARICLAYSVIEREPNLPRLGSPTSTGGGGCHYIEISRKNIYEDILNISVDYIEGGIMKCHMKISTKV